MCRFFTKKTARSKPIKAIEDEYKKGKREAEIARRKRRGQAEQSDDPQTSGKIIDAAYADYMSTLDRLEKTRERQYAEQNQEPPIPRHRRK